MMVTSDQTKERTMIDTSAFTVDSPEVAALKAKVREVADRYTKKNGWCGEVKRALKEAGVMQENIEVEVVTTIGNRRMRVDPSQLVGLDNEGQLAFFAERIGTVNLPHPWVGEIEYAVIDVNLIEKAEPKQSDHNWVYASLDGRVLHRVETPRYASCGTWLEPGSGPGTSGHLVSPRGEGRRCVKCNRIDSQ